MKNTHKLAIFGALILCVFFVLSKNVKADTLVDQPVIDLGFDLESGSLYGTFQYYATSTNFNSTKKIGSIDLHLKKVGDGTYAGDCYVFAQIKDENLTQYNSTASTSWAQLTTDFELYIFNFDINNTIDLSIHKLKFAGMKASGNCAAGGNWAHHIGVGISTTNVLSGSNLYNEGTYFDDYDLNFTLYDQFGGTIYSIGFPNYFTNGTTTPDFRNWHADVVAPTGAFPHIIVNYGLASSTTWNYAQHDYYYFTSVFTQPYDFTMSFPKNTPLASGNTYNAQLFLNDNTTGATLASSTIYSFTVSTGTPINAIGYTEVLPPEQLWDDSWCPDTAFSVLGADFGKGICKVFAFLFVPNFSALGQYSRLQDTMKTHAPFSYFYELSAALTAISPSSSSISNLTITTGTSSPIQINQTIFSSSTLSYFTSSRISLFRDLMSGALYFMFVAMVITSIRNAFRGGEVGTDDTKGGKK